MRHKWLIITLVVIMVLGFAFTAGVVSYFIGGGEGRGSTSVFAGKKIGVIEVNGFIASADDLVKDIEDVRKDDNIASVVLRIESPGGTIGGSQEILEAVKKMAEKKPVVASMGSVAASGGYYVACGATKILANPGTVTGSIGVRMDHLTVGLLLKWAKIGHETLKSGKYKDIGSFDRPITPEERAILEGVLTDLHQQFKETVAQARKLPMEKVDELADGRVFTGRQAKDLGLVDELGGFVEAIRLAADLGGIKGEPRLSYQKKKGQIFLRLFEGVKSMLSDAADFPLSNFDFLQPVMSLPARAPAL
ncbi:MAG: signal peptide peptidase SppA [bacterium]